MQEYRETKSKIWRVGEVVKLTCAGRAKGLYKILDIWQPTHEIQGQKIKNTLASIIRCDKAGNEILTELLCEGKMVRVSETISIKHLAKTDF